MADTDKKIANLLLKDGNMRYRQIAKILKISTSSAFNKVKKLFDSGSIIKIVPVFSDKFTGLKYQIILRVQVYGEHINEVEKDISGMPEVCAVYDVTGDDDILVIAKFRTKENMDEFVKKLHSIKNIRKTNTSFVLNKVKEEFTFKGFT